MAQYERGRRFATHRFPTLFEAGAYLLGTLTILPARLRAGGAGTSTVAALDDWPVQPLPGEPPLTLPAHRRMVPLMAGREVVRPGGGRGYPLPRSVGEHLADGSLADITGGE
ncbi:hypothetical protein [Lentzea sp.]|uniref:hypothetical protein n=1 Tax=Lentzea sp. TaxID=56099 RepID=UPI002B9E823E|nr:hypothetical protein [Lentzea sp.]HUQ57836.1 hypothetical protein [Lentzea sp.]